MPRGAASSPAPACPNTSHPRPERVPEQSPQQLEARREPVPVHRDRHDDRRDRSQGIKIVDYFVDAAGNLEFRETSSFTLPNANTWAAEDFKIVDNADGTRTYFIAADDIHRGIDVLSWTGPPNPTGAQAPAASSGATATNLSLLGMAGILLPVAALVGRRRRTTR